MTEITEVDIPEPEQEVEQAGADRARFDPGADELPPRSDRLPLGEDPAYDPGGMGRQPDVAEEDEEHR